MGSYPWGPHGPQSSPHEVTPNPTPAYVPPPSYTPPVYAPQGSSPVAYGGGSVGYAGPSRPRRKGYFVALILTFFFGPLGLFYATRKGALLLLLLVFAVPITLGAMGVLPGGSLSHPFAVLDHDSIMAPIWSFCTFIAMVWSVIAVNRFNAAQKAKS